MYFVPVLVVLLSTGPFFKTKNRYCVPFHSYHVFVLPLVIIHSFIQIEFDFPFPFPHPPRGAVALSFCSCFFCF